ncbi:MAG: antibiotic biosynthesis monooxygenase [Muribaculaceae bacterium]|nr:antibiotic biosynthesis monooxygenase [Muribaculaceae bacterium]
MIRSLKILLSFAAALILFSGCGGGHSTEASTEKFDMCEKLPMQSDGIVRLSKIKVNPEYIDEYMKYAVEVGTTSLETEPGVLTMYAVADKENPFLITILETYASQEAYRSHIASEHFQKYKQGTLHMVDSLQLDDVIPLNPRNKLSNFIE